MPYLWGLSNGAWHALTRHDPDFSECTERVASKKLTAAARQQDPDAEPVYVTVNLPGRRPKPGTGAMKCGLEQQPLESLGVDPVPGDSLCPVCRSLVDKEEAAAPR